MRFQVPNALAMACICTHFLPQIAQIYNLLKALAAASFQHNLKRYQNLLPLAELNSWLGGRRISHMSSGQRKHNEEVGQASLVYPLSIEVPFLAAQGI